MAYADKQGLSGSKVASIIIVILIHVALGYAFVTGLAFNVIKKVATDLKTFDVQEEPPPPEQKPPPPPPDKPLEPPPVVSPPPIVQAPTVQAPVIFTQPVAPPRPAPAPPAPPPPPPPPPPPTISKAAQAKGNPGRFFTQDAYPPRALREGAEGTVRIAYDIGADGRVENCHVTSSSGNSELDDATCRIMTSKVRFSPALDASGNPMRSTGSQNIRWQIQR